MRLRGLLIIRKSTILEQGAPLEPRLSRNIFLETVGSSGAAFISRNVFLETGGLLRSRVYLAITYF
jgi:hypothetical protein